MTNPTERIPGESRPLQATHIDVLSVTASLAGLSPVSVKAARVLEIRCAVGGNLLPMAQAFPESTFAGIDTSTRHIAMAQKTATGAGLKNIRFEVRDFTRLPDNFGTFDYIIAHGVYHWVNPAAREQLLGIIKRLLSPDGVAYVNYNVYPGWRPREMFRDILVSKTAGKTDPVAIATDARAFMAFLSRHLKPTGEGVYAAQLRQETALLSGAPDDYLVYEYLQASPTALYFQQFADQLILNELNYVGEVKAPPARRRLYDELVAEEMELKQDWARLEQLIDYIQGPFVRRSLICHSDKAVLRTAQIQAPESMFMRCMVVPTSQGNVRSNDPISFRFPDGGVVNLADPIAKTILVALARVWPNTISFEQLLGVIRIDLQFGDVFAAPASLDRMMVLSGLVALYAVTLIDLHAAPATFVSYAGEKPLATPLARFQARESKTVTNQHHLLVITLSKVDRLVLAHVNGTRDRAALIAVLKAAIAKGILPNPDTDPTAAAEVGLANPLDQTLEQSLAKLAANALLSA